MSVDLSLLWSSLMLKTISLEMAEVKSVRVALGKTTLPVQFILENGQLFVTQQKQVEFAAGDNNGNHYDLSVGLRMRLIESQRNRANFLFELLELLFQSTD
jgi:hypothetical protein